MENFDSLPILKSFKGLKQGDRVYSKKYGLGKVAELSKEDEVFVDFSWQQTKITELDKEIALIPDVSPKKKSLQNKSKALEVFIGDEKVSFKEFKRRQEIERRRQKYEDDLRKMKEKEAKKKSTLVPKQGIVINKTKKVPTEVANKDITNKQPDLYAELIKLDDLRKKGILTEDEFQAQKRLLLEKQQ